MNSQASSCANGQHANLEQSRTSCGTPSETSKTCPQATTFNERTRPRLQQFKLPPSPLVGHVARIVSLCALQQLCLAISMSSSLVDSCLSLAQRQSYALPAINVNQLREEYTGKSVVVHHLSTGHRPSCAPPTTSWPG